MAITEAMKTKYFLEINFLYYLNVFSDDLIMLLG
jgi:hypothetical protein